MTFDLEMYYEDKTFIVHASYSPGRPGKFYGPPENCYPEEFPEVEYSLEWFKDLENIVRLVYPPRIMAKHLKENQSYEVFLSREAGKLHDRIIEKIEEAASGE